MISPMTNYFLCRTARETPIPQSDVFFLTFRREDDINSIYETTAVGNKVSLGVFYGNLWFRLHPTTHKIEEVVRGVYGAVLRG